MSSMINFYFPRLRCLFRQSQDEKLQRYESVAPEAQEGLLNSSEEVRDIPIQDTTNTRCPSRWAFTAPVMWILGCLVPTSGIYIYSSAASCTAGSSFVCSPAQEALRYKESIYPDAFEELTHFMGDPSPQLDSYWEETYDLPTRIPKWQADKLDQPTIQYPSNSGDYVVLLDVFHSMHCLNEIRKELHPHYYEPYHLSMNITEKIARMHLEHCVEHVRLSLWCNADISPISFRWKGDHHVSGKSGYPHMCRDARAIIGWARENRVQKPLP